MVLLDFPPDQFTGTDQKEKFFVCLFSMPVPPSQGHQPTFRSVLRTQMKVQTDGLMLDLRTTNPPGPFSPLMRP